MNRQWTFVCLLLSVIHASFQASTPDSPTYRAAVVEFPPHYEGNNSRVTLQTNSDKYVELITKANKENVDIIVFPEDGLTSYQLPIREHLESWTTLIPKASDNYIPCINDTIAVSSTLKKMSCAARNNSIYVVVNIAEKLPCTGKECPTDKKFYYNSNVVFDRTGKVIARYRKTNLFLEEQFNVTDVPEIITFQTDFGVKFGTMICFDVLFYQPALNLTRTENITDIIFPTAWFSEAPFLTALQTHWGWSYAEDVNFLSAGYNNPKMGNSGSGIFLGRNGIAVATLPTTERQELLIYDVPKKNRKSSTFSERSYLPEHEHVHSKITRDQKLGELYLIQDDLTVWQTEPFSGSVNKTVCDHSFCCDFKIEMAHTNSSIKYRMAVFNGTRSYVGLINAGTIACAILHCSNDSVNSCGFVEESVAVFNKIEISGKFDNYKNLLIMPSAIYSDLYPVRNFTLDKHTHDDHVHAKMSLLSPEKDILVFGIYARDFSRDHVTNTTNTATANNSHLIVMFTTLFLSYFVIKFCSRHGEHL